MSEKEPKTRFDRIAEADAEAERAFASMKGFESQADLEDAAAVSAYALIAIAAELRAARIAQRPTR